MNDKTFTEQTSHLTQDEMTAVSIAALVILLVRKGLVTESEIQNEVLAWMRYLHLEKGTLQ